MSPVYPGLERLDPLSRTVIVVGDTQETSWLEVILEQNRKLRPTLLSEIARRGPDAVLHLGDLVTWGASGRHWARLDAELEPLRASGTPLLPVVGNHDRWPRQRAAEERLAERFQVLATTTWYSFRVQGVAFVALDSNFAPLGRDRNAAQLEWLDHTLAELEADPGVRAIIGYWHHAAWTNSRLVRPSSGVQELFLPRFAQASKAVAIFSGHCHGYERFEDRGLTLIVSGGGGGPRHRLAIDKRRRDLFRGDAVRFLHFCELELGPELVVRVVRFRPDLGFDVAETFALGSARGGGHGVDGWPTPDDDGRQSNSGNP
jgi:hypothetical protein